MKISRRLITLILSVLIWAGAGCTSGSSRDDTIVVWHWMNDRHDSFRKLARRYKEQTGTNVEFKLFPAPEYAQKIFAAGRAGNLPDIFGILGEKKTLASFIKAGHIMDLTPAMDENEKSWKNSFYPQTLAVNYFASQNDYDIKTGIYGVPIDSMVMQFVYNRALFDAAGLDPDAPPRTIEEFVADAQTIQEKLGVYGFVCGWGEGWLIECMATEWAINIMGEKKFRDTIGGKIPYTDPGWLQVFSLFSRIKEAGILAPNIVTMVNKESEEIFAQGRAAFAFNGNWGVNVYKNLAPKLDYAFFPLPAITQKSPLKLWGGAGSSFMVNNNSPRKNDAVDFLRWLTAPPQQQFLVDKTSNLPAISYTEIALGQKLSLLAESLDKLTHPNIWPANEDTRVLEVMRKGLQQIVMGIKSPQEVARQLQETKERIKR